MTTRQNNSNATLKESIVIAYLEVDQGIMGNKAVTSSACEDAVLTKLIKGTHACTQNRPLF